MNHKDLDVWKHSMDLVQLVYDETEKFPKEELFGLTNQVRRAAVSVPSNIAEGCARKGNAETIQFLYIALGSLAELETQFLLAERLNYVKNEDLIEKIGNIGRMIMGLIKYLKTKHE